MIDLNAASVGDEFNYVDYYRDSSTFGVFSHKLVMTLVSKGSDDYVLIDQNGSHHVIDKGSDSTNGTDFRLRSKYDHRHWLKDLPDADLFDSSVDWVECHWKNKGNFWFGSNEGIEAEYWIPLKMPTITEEECEQSRISIPELRKWQVQSCAKK